VDVTEPSLWRRPDFMKLRNEQAVSELGSVVTRTALPLAAIITLHATAFEVGILVASASTAVLLVGLFAGALVDRSRRRATHDRGGRDPRGPPPICSGGGDRRRPSHRRRSWRRASCSFRSCSVMGWTPWRGSTS
jgi:MFS family permease